LLRCWLLNCCLFPPHVVAPFSNLLRCLKKYCR
jgi:hypothetical protein